MIFITAMIAPVYLRNLFSVHRASCRCYSSNHVGLLSYKVFDPPANHPAIAKHPVLIFHGLFGSKQNWQSIAKSLSHRLGQKIITTDARNHGDSPHFPDHTYYSMVEDTEQLLDHLDIPQAVLIGHSMGGKTAMCFALERHPRVETIIVVDSAPSLSPGKSSFQSIINAMKSARINPFGRLPEERGKAMKEFEKTIPELMVRQFILTNLVEKDGKITWRVNLDAIEKHMEHLMDFPVYHNFFGLPCLFIAGAKSNYITDEEMPEIKRLFPKADIVKVPEAGHWVHSDKPAEVIETIVHFLKNKEDQ